MFHISATLGPGLILLAGVLLIPFSSADAAEPPRTLEKIRRFNPWLSADDPLQLPLKLHSLLRDEYTFFRGTVDLYYDWCRDNCHDWLTSGHALFLHGDVHLGNIGTYRSVAGNRFAVVDLDETFTGPYQLDLLRGLLSLRFAASDNRIKLSSEDRAELIDRYLAAYAESLNGRNSVEDMDTRHPLVKSLLKQVRQASAAEYAEKFCSGKPPSRFRPVRIKKDRVSDIMTPVDEKTHRSIAESVRTFLTSDYEGFNPGPTKPHLDAKDILDVVQWSRIDSGGSQGVKKYLVLVAPNKVWDNAPLILQLKEEPLPAAARAGLVAASPNNERAARVATQYLLLIDPLPWLTGHVEINGRGFLIRTKDPFSEEPESDDFKTRDALMQGAQLLGETLGHAHRGGLRTPKGLQLIPAITGELKALAPELATRSDAAMDHLHKAFVNLKQDGEAQKMVEAAKRRINEAKKAGA